MRSLFPLAIDLQNRRCVVVGAGAVAERRVLSLLEAEAQVKVIAPGATERIADLASLNRIELQSREYVSSDLDGAFLVIAATDDSAVNAGIVRVARSRGILTNDAETPERGDFVVPSVVRRGSLMLTVTTAGASPSLASRIRQSLERQYGPEYEPYVMLLAEVRDAAITLIPDVRERRAALRRLAEQDEIRELLRAGRTEEARTKAFACISSLSD
jgi:precorrin-2 dehydrogenase / sirohydrochlorin ferrochelatase